MENHCYFLELDVEYVVVAHFFRLFVWWVFLTREFVCAALLQRHSPICDLLFWQKMSRISCRDAHINNI